VSITPRASRVTFASQRRPIRTKTHATAKFFNRSA
jgi:hypothetical protein